MNTSESDDWKRQENDKSSALHPRTSSTGSPKQVQVCVIHETKRHELWLVGDQFVPTERIAHRFSEWKNFTGTIYTESANKSFDSTPLENESFVAMFALIKMKSDIKNIEYQFITLGERGALYICPQCGVLLKKNIGILDFAKSGSEITGNQRCVTCGVSFPSAAVYAGKYDL